jgi:predicted small secreted protein
MRATRNIVLSICFVLPLAAKSQDGAGQDIKDAGDSAKTAVTKTGAATGKVTVKGLKATGRGLTWGAQKLALGTGAGVEKSGAALKSVGK